MPTKSDSSTYGLECLEASGDDLPLCVGEDWLEFPNYAAARMAAQLLAATTGYEFRIVNFQKCQQKVHQQ